MARKVINDAANRVEIYFDGKPSEEVRNYLKEHRFRWFSYAQCWYNYKSAHNIEVADKALEMATQSKSVTPARRPAPVVKQTELFSVGEYVLFCKNGKWHFGKVFSYHSPSSIGIGYYASYQNGTPEYKAEFFDSEKHQIQDTVLERYTYIPSVGSVVKFENDTADIMVGIIEREDFSGRATVRTYSLSNSGEISAHFCYHVSAERILDRYIYADPNDVAHISIGDKIEYFSEEDYETRKGTITKIDDDFSSLTVAYQWKSQWGTTYERTETVEIDGIVKLGRLGKSLNRSDFISDEHQDDIAYNEGIKSRIKTKSDDFADATAAWSQRPLYRHQLAGSLLADKYNKFAFFYDTGTGKTVMALNIIEKKFEQEKIRFLIIAPKSIIKTAWVDDAIEFYPTLRLLPLHKGFDVHKKNALYRAWMTGASVGAAMHDKVLLAHAKFLANAMDIKSYYSFSHSEVDKKLHEMAQHYIINPEMFIQKPEYYIQTYGITGIIMDESALLKNYDSKTSKVMREVCASMKYVYLLSGKPAPNNEMEYFSQMKIVAPEMFPFSYDRFLSMFCTYGGAHKHRLSEESKQLFSEMVSAKSLIVSKKDCLDLPDTTDVVRLVELPEAIMDDYNELYYECMVLIKGMDNSTVFYSTQSKMAVLMKLRQMASGFFMQANGVSAERRLIVDIHKEKINEVKSIIEEIPDEQVIIWCQFQHEIELLEQELSKTATVVTAYGKTKNLEDNIDAFKNGRAQYIIAHPKTLKYGVTFTNCHYTIYYSFSYSAEDYDQSHDRNYRLGQTEPCTYFYIQAEDTIDEIMHLKVMRKLSNAEFFEQLIKDAAKHGIDYDNLKGKTDEEIKSALHTTNSIFGVVDESDTALLSVGDESTVGKRKKERGALQNRTKLVRVDDGIEPTAAELLKIEREERRRKLHKPSCDTFGVYEGEESIWAKHIRTTLTDEDLAFLHGDIWSGYFRSSSSQGYREISLIEDDDPVRYIKAIESSPSIDIGMADILRKVFRILETLPKNEADTVCLYYGLMDGRPRSYAWLSEHYGEFYDEELDYSYEIVPWIYSAIGEAERSVSYHSSQFSQYEGLIEKLV